MCLFSRSGRLNRYHPHTWPDPSRASQASGRASVQPFASQPVKARCDIPGVFGASTGSPARYIS